MNREFLDLYNRELGLLKEQASAFADEYPGIAERLGGLVDERADPMVAGLLEGAAFLAARVQLKIKHEFPEFTYNLIEQLVPNYLAPTPSVLLARVRPPFGDPALRDGRPIPQGAVIDATYRERERQVACRYRLTTPVTLWPFEIAAADYLVGPGALHALGVPAPADTASGLRLTLLHRTTARPEDEPPERDAARTPLGCFAGCAVDDLPVHLLGGEADAAALYEQLFGDCTGVFLRYLDAFGDPVAVSLGADALEPLGFGADDTLLPKDLRVFDGFDLLREYFMFPRKFLGFRLRGLKRHLPAMAARSLDLVVTFDEANPRLSAAVKPGAFALYAAPAINLFEMALDRVPVRTSQHEYHLVPDRSRTLDFEPHRVVEVYAHHAGRPDKVPVAPLYSAPGEAGARAGLHYTVRRLPRRRSTQERSYGAASDYTGTDLFLSLSTPNRLDEDATVTELSVRALCSNRHLPEQLPVGEGGADFRLADDVGLDVVCEAGPTRPRDPVVAQLRSRTEVAGTGAVAWRLVNMLSLNHLGLVRRGGGAGGAALREMAVLFADLTDGTTERRIRGIRSVDSRPVVRRLRSRSGTGTARGTEITITLDEKAFEGTGAFLLGAVLDRFFADYAGVNHFTQVVVRSTERGVILHGPARSGTRRPL